MNMDGNLFGTAEQPQQEESQLRDHDLVRWIENKLSDSRELWAGSQAASMLNKEMLVELETCFQGLEPHIKLKIIQAIAHLTPKQLQMWHEPLTNLLDLARRDPDDWVETIAEAYRDYPERGCIRTAVASHSDQHPDEEESYFTRTLQELVKLVGGMLRRGAKQPSGDKEPRPLPPDSLMLSAAANRARYGYAEAEFRQPGFHLRRQRSGPSKSEQLLADVKRIAEQHINLATSGQRKYNSINQGLTVSSSFPIKMRSTARRPDDTLPMRGIPTSFNGGGLAKISGGFTNEPKKRFQQQRPALQREGGAQLINIADLPNPHRKSRGKFAPPPASVTTTITKPSPSKGNEVKSSKKEERGDKRVKQSDKSGEQVDGVPSEKLGAAGSKRMKLNAHYREEPNSSQSSADSAQQSASTTEIEKAANQLEETMSAIKAEASSPVDIKPAIQTQIHVQEIVHPSSSTVKPEPVTNPPLANNNNSAIAQLTAHPTNSTVKAEPVVADPPLANNLAIAQLMEIVNTSNKVTPITYNLITAFLSGNRHNPLEAKLGSVVTLPLSDTVELDKSPVTGQWLYQRVETFFQMDYRSGEWRRLKKTQPLQPDEVTALQEEVARQGCAQTQQPTVIVGTESNARERKELASAASTAHIPNGLLQQQWDVNRY